PFAGIFSTQGTTTHLPDNKTAISDPVKIKVTVLTLQDPWLGNEDLSAMETRQALLGNTTVYVQSEELLLANEKVDNPIGNNTQETDHVELDDLYDGLKSGQRVIISGERADVFQADGLTPIPGIKA